MNEHARFIRLSIPVLAGVAASFAFLIVDASARTDCNSSSGPDLIMGEITAPTNYISDNGIEAFAVGFVHCNIGNAMLNTIASPSTQHQTTGQNLFRYKTVGGAQRLEQIGQSWLLDGYCSLQSNVCCTCQPAPVCTHLGAGCSSPEAGGGAGSQAVLRPKWQVNAANGTFPVPPANPPFSGPVARRLQAKISDIDPAQDGGGQYYVEVFALAADDAAAGNKQNNASYRQCAITGGGSAWNMAIMSTTQREHPAVQAWQDSDPSVMLTSIDVPGDGRFIIAAKATDLGGGQWHYEYAIENMNSDRSGQSFSVPLPAAALISNIGFHDVDYHDGDGIGSVNFDGTDWPASVGRSAITWSTDSFDNNPNANALRFATLYNFRFDANVAPTPASAPGTITLGLFKGGAPNSVTAITITPGVPPPPPECTADIAPAGPPQGDGVVNVDDLLMVINNWGSCPAPPASCSADIVHDGTVNVDDLLAVINHWGACP